LQGGGPTPVAAGLQLALLTARQVRARGMAPVLVLLTDGRANIALDGTAGRLQAGDDAQAMARAISTEALPSIIIDTNFMPSSTLGALGREMRAQVLPLPRADAGRIAGALDLALSGTV
jgi:magnesium chelatase subunit D